MVEVCEENVEDLRVPADWVALDALLDVLLSNVSASSREKRMIVDRWENNIPRVAQASQTCCQLGK